MMATKLRYTSATPKPRGIHTRVSARTIGLSRNAISPATRKRKTT